LISAAARGLTGEVRQLLAGKIAVNYLDKNGCSAIYLAASGGHEDVVKLLLEAGANVNLRIRYAPLSAGGRWSEGVTALMSAASTGNSSMVRLLLQAGTDINAVNKDGETALILAMQNQHSEAAQALIEAGADLTVQCKHVTFLIGLGYRTALMIAAENGDEEMVKRLQAAGAKEEDIDITLLVGAAKYGKVATIRRLVESGINLDARDRVSGRFALSMAAFGGHIEVVKPLLEAGASLNPEKTDPLKAAIQGAEFKEMLTICRSLVAMRRLCGP